MLTRVEHLRVISSSFPETHVHLAVTLATESLALLGTHVTFYPASVAGRGVVVAPGFRPASGAKVKN